MNEIKTLEEADNVATRIAELELEITLTNTRFDLRRQRLEQQKASTTAPLAAERDALYAKLDRFASINTTGLKRRLIPGGYWGIAKSRYSTKVDENVFDPESESKRFGIKLYTAKPDLDAIGKLLAEGEEIAGAWRERGRDRVKVTLDKKLTESRVDEATMRRNMIDMEKLLSGSIPESLEEKTEAAGAIIRIARRIVPVTSLLIASARRDHFGKSVTEWTAWCSENFDLDGAERDHRRAIGDLLLAVRENTDLFETLFALSFDKLISLTRIPPDQIAAFLSHLNGDIRKISRDDLRDEVKRWLGEKVQERKGAANQDQPELPGFSEAVGAILSMQPQRLLAEVTDDESAKRILDGGFRLVGSALEFKKREEHPDVLFLQTVKTALLQEIEEIEAAIARAESKNE